MIIRSPGKNGGRGQFDLEPHLSESYIGKVALQRQRSRKGWPNQRTDSRGPGQDRLISMRTEAVTSFISAKKLVICNSNYYYLPSTYFASMTLTILIFLKHHNSTRGG